MYNGTTIYKYQKKNGSIRSIKTTKPIIKAKETFITVWDDENKGYRSMIINRILQTITSYKYKKKDGSIRSIKTDRDVIEKENYLKIWDIENEGWRTMIKRKILQDI